MPTSEIETSFLGIPIKTKKLKPGERVPLQKEKHIDGKKRVWVTRGAEVQYDGSARQYEKKTAVELCGLSTGSVTHTGNIGLSIDGKELPRRIPGLKRIFTYKR